MIKLKDQQDQRDVKVIAGVPGVIAVHPIKYVPPPEYGICLRQRGPPNVAQANQPDNRTLSVGSCCSEGYSRGPYYHSKVFHITILINSLPKI